jgi:hypothetical protein
MRVGYVVKRFPRYSRPSWSRRSQPTKRRAGRSRSSPAPPTTPTSTDLLPHARPGALSAQRGHAASRLLGRPPRMRRRLCPSAGARCKTQEASWPATSTRRCCWPSRCGGEDSNTSMRTLPQPAGHGGTAPGGWPACRSPLPRMPRTSSTRPSGRTTCAASLEDTAAVVTVSEFNLGYLQQTYWPVGPPGPRLYNGLDLDASPP